MNRVGKNIKGEVQKHFSLGKARKVEGKTFPTWLDANKLTLSNIIKKILLSKAKNDAYKLNMVKAHK